MADRLPVSFADGQLTVATTPAMHWPASAVSLSLYYRNPLAPARRVWWFAGVYSKPDLDDKLAQVTERGTFAPSPDLIVARRSDFAVLATAQIEPDWTLRRPGAGTPATTRWPHPNDLRRLAADTIRAAHDVQISLVNPYGDQFTPDHISWPDLTVDEALALIKPRRLMIVRLAGKDLAELRATVKSRQNDPDHQWSGIAPDALKANQTYRVLVDDDAAELLLGKWNAVMTDQFIPAEAFPDHRRQLIRQP